MNSTLQPKKDDNGLNGQFELGDASALLALLHGKSDSICRLFNKEILVDKKQLASLNESMCDKLALHSTSPILTSIDITFINKKILTFKSWPEFERYDFEKVNSSTKNVFVQWDFFVKLDSYQCPQRHTVSVRLSSTPDPSDFFKVLLSGAFDESHDLDIQSCTMICKVDFVNNTLAEELVNVAHRWNELCESATTKKGKLRRLLYKYRNNCAHILEICSSFCITLIIGICLKILLQRGIFQISAQTLLYTMFAVIPISMLVKKIANTCARKIYNAFGDLMDTHVFLISKGDSKQQEQIEKNSKFGKELVVFLLNAIFSIVLSVVFFVIG